MGLGLKLQNELPLRDNVLLARYAEARGLDSVWTSEYRSEAVIPMAAYAAATERVTVGSSIIPLYTRSIPALATTAAGLEALAPGRVVLGLGTSSPVIVERWHGVPRARPLRAMAEHVAALKRLLAGERLDFDGEVVRVKGFELDVAEAPRTPVHVAALGRPMLAVAGREADGALLNAAPFSHLPAMRQALDGAARQAGRSDRLRLAGDVRIGIGTGARAERLRRRLRENVAYYATTKAYNSFFAEAGYTAQAAALKAAWADRDRDRAFAAVDDEMLDDLVLVGDESAVAERIAEVAEVLDTVILFPTWEDEGAAAATQRLIEIAAEVAP